MSSYVSEWFASNVDLTYPFTDTAALSSGSSSSSSDADRFTLNRLVVDAKISHRLNSLNVHVERVEVSAGVIRFYFNDELAYISHLSTVFDSWVCQRYRLSVDNSDIFITLIINLDEVNELDDGEYIPDYNEFIPGCYDKQASRVDSVTIFDPAIELSELDISGMILAEGFNVGISQQQVVDNLNLPFESVADSRESTVLVFSAEPGLGLGKKEADCGNVGLRTINGVVPDDNGRLSIDLDDCMTVRKKSVTNPNTLLWRHDCEPCCECNDYVSVYEATRRQVEYGESVQNKLNLVHYQLTNIISAWNSQCSDAVKFSMRLYARYGWVVAAQSMVFNATDSILKNVKLEFNVSSESPSILVPGSGYATTDMKKNISHDPVVSGDKYTVNWTNINLRPGKLFIYSFELFFSSDDNRAAGNTVSVNSKAIISGYSDIIAASTTTLKGHNG